MYMCVCVCARTHTHTHTHTHTRSAGPREPGSQVDLCHVPLCRLTSASSVSSVDSEVELLSPGSLPQYHLSLHRNFALGVFRKMCLLVV